MINSYENSNYLHKSCPVQPVCKLSLNHKNRGLLFLTNIDINDSLLLVFLEPFLPVSDDYFNAKRIIEV